MTLSSGPPSGAEGEARNPEPVPKVRGERRWTDDEGNEGVFFNGRLSIFGKPSMTADDGSVAMGVDASWLSDLARQLEEARKRAAQYEADHLYVEEAEAKLEEAREALRPFANLADDPFLMNHKSGRVTVPAEWLVSAREALARAGTGEGE